MAFVRLVSQPCTSSQCVAATGTCCLLTILGSHCANPGSCERSWCRSLNLKWDSLVTAAWNTSVVHCCSLCYFAERKMRSIAVSVSVCLYRRISTHISRKPNVRTSQNFLYVSVVVPWTYEDSAVSYNMYHHFCG